MRSDMTRIIRRVLLLVSGLLATALAAVLISAKNSNQSQHGQLTARATVLAAMKQRPTDPWPRGVGHVILAPPGSREEWKSYLEPGGSFSPTAASGFQSGY